MSTPYTTLDHLPDLTPSEMAAAGRLAFKPSTTNSSGWDNTATVYGSDSYALLHDTYVFSAKEGATYDVFSTSYFDPYLLSIFDSAGNTIVANDENDDPAAFSLSDGGYYNSDVLFDWVAPYSGTYYVSASWHQGSYYTFYSLSLHEDIDTIPTTRTPTIIGTSANDSFSIGSGNKVIDAGAGIDTVVFPSQRANYTVTKTDVGYTVKDNFGTTGTETLTNIERLQFRDTNVALDLDGHAGQAVKILGAVFGPASVSNKQWVGMALSALDGGWSYEKVAAEAVNIAGRVSHAEVAALLWTNLVGSAPTPGQDAWVVAMLDNGMSVGHLTVLAADLSQNTENIHLVGLAKTGIEFV